MSAWYLRMTAYDKRDEAISARYIARHNLRMGRRMYHREEMRRAIRAWKRFKELLRDSQELAA